MLMTDILFFRYRISGSSLLAAMDQSGQVPFLDSHLDDKEPIDGPYNNVNREKIKNNLDFSYLQAKDEMHARVDDKNGRVQPSVDVAEIIRRRTHALQRIHKQSLHLVCFLLLCSVAVLLN